jgi:hypothetical protein
MFYKQLNGNKNEKQLQLSVPIIQSPVAILFSWHRHLRKISKVEKIDYPLKMNL